MPTDQPTKVLIVTGDARLREPATEVLLRAGFVVDQAPDTTAALESIRAHRVPEIVLLDAPSLVEGLDGFLDGLAGVVPKTVLLAGDATPASVREHPSVVYVIEAPAAVRSLVALADWIAEGDPHGRPSVVLKPLSRVASRAPGATQRVQRSGT